MNKSLLITACAALSICAYADVSSRYLHDNWRFRQWRSDNWFEATVPGTVHTDLMNNDLIEDPFFRLNERSVQWVDKEDWMYETTFIADKAEVDAANQQLIFYGLDTYADVYLNHNRIVVANNMHRTWRTDVKGILQEGENLLEVFFHSPIKVDLPKYDKYNYKFNTGPDQSQNGGIFDKTLSIFARKAGYHYGWDWGPRLVTSGIWRPIELLTWNGQRIADVQYIQTDVNAKRAKLTTVVEINSDSDVKGATVSVTADNAVVATTTTDLKKGENRVTLNYEIKKPRLWWTNGLGEQYLYDFGATLIVDGKQADTKHHNIGVRSLKMITKPDAEGYALYFELNGKPVFAKGVDMVPLDNFLPRITREKYEKHVLDAKNVNMNMIRVWGGGVYEDDYLYELCDKHGILIWQDFMFACSTYPADDEFLANIRQEAIDNVKRLRNHSSIAVWCGNNECQDVYYGWGGKLEYYKSLGVDSITTPQFKAMYFKVLPEVVKEYGGGIGYRPSSPFAFEETPSDGKNGDSHYWGVWHGRDSIGHYNIEKSRFFSEYGFQSFPEFESIKIYAPQERDWSITSEAMMCHQRAGSYANGLIRDYMDYELRIPTDFPTFVYVGSILQGDAIKTAIEAHRRDMPHCMGTLVWQHNDCWPVASWAGRDYYGRWKAQQYYSKAAFDDILVSPLVLGDSLSVTIVNDRRTDARGTVTFKIMDLKGNIIKQISKRHNAQALSSETIISGLINDYIGNYDRGDIILVASFDDGSRTYDNVAYACRQKFMNYERPNIAVDITPNGDGYDLTLSTDIFARAVFLSLDGIDNFFSDNYFNILPNSTKSIHVSTPLSTDDFKRQLKLISLGDAFANSTISQTESMQSSKNYKPLGD